MVSLVEDTRAVVSLAEQFKAGFKEATEDCFRQVVLDTETTGLSPKNGHRLVEIGCVELLDGRKTGRQFHTYLNPERKVSKEAERVHGLNEHKLQHQPVFAEIVVDFLEFILDSELVIHNAPFDLRFIDAELEKLRIVSITYCCDVVDTLELARKLEKNVAHNLDSMCELFGIDNSLRTLHSAAVDASLLAEVYIALGKKHKLKKFFVRTDS